MIDWAISLADVQGSAGTDHGKYSPQPTAATSCASITASIAAPIGGRYPRPALAAKAMGVASAIVKPAVIVMVIVLCWNTAAGAAGSATAAPTPRPTT